MEKLREALNNEEFWDKTFNKMSTKQGISKSDLNDMIVLKEFHRNTVIDEIMSGAYNWSIPVKKEIAKAGTNKKRIVYVYSIRDRYVLGVLYRAVSHRFRDKQSELCFSYKTGVNTSDAIRYISNNKSNQHNFGVKIDIHAYFNSVSKERVVEIINELFTGGCKVTMEKLLLDDRVIWNGKEINEFKSLIPGCAFGSFLANYCLRECDAYFENQDCIYSRYSDDIIILDSSREKLEEHLEIVKCFLAKYGLEINPKKYTWFKPGEAVEYLGLKLLGNGDIDISDHAKQKIKKQIHRWCRKGRIEIENEHKNFEIVARRIIRQLNNKNFKCYIRNEATFGWCHYSFRYITTIQSLIEIDFYTRDTLRAMKTGKHNKNNVKALNDEDFKKLGWVSLVDLYNLYHEDFDYYCEIIELI